MLDLYDNNAADDCELVTTFTSVQTSGTLILYVRTGDATFGNEIQIRDSTNIKIRLIIGWLILLQNDDGGGFDNLQAMSDDTMVSIQLIFDCGTDGAFDLYIDGTLYTGPLDFTLRQQISIIYYYQHIMGILIITSMLTSPISHGIPAFGAITSAWAVSGILPNGSNQKRFLKRSEP